MSTGNEGGSITEQAAALATARTGRELPFGQVKVLDKGLFMQVAEVVIARLAAPHMEAQAYAQEDGSLHVLLSDGENVILKELRLPAGTWELVPQTDVDRLSEQLMAAVESGDTDALIGELEGLITARMEDLEAKGRAWERSQGALLVADRSAPGLGVIAEMAQVSPKLRATIDAWVASSAPFLLAFVQRGSGSAEAVWPVASEADLMGPALTRLQEAGVPLATTLPVIVTAQGHRESFAQAWVEAGGGTHDELAEHGEGDAGTGRPEEPGFIFAPYFTLVPEALVPLVAPGVEALALVEFSREAVDSGDLQPIRRLIKDILFALGDEMAGEVAFTVAGYENDPRLLSDIPEIVQFARRLLDQVPEWLYLIQRVQEEFNMWVAVLTGSTGEKTSAGHVFYYYDAATVANLHHTLRETIIPAALKQLEIAPEDGRALQFRQDVDALIEGLRPISGTRH